LEYLIRAEPLITAEVPSAKIVIAGQGENFERYRRLIKNPEQFLVLNQYISPEQQTELFRQASLVVLPYVEASQSGVIPVAYTFAKPVVATTVGALPEMVDDGRTGYLVPPRDPEALAVAIVRLLKDRHLRRRVGQNGKRKIDSECSPEVVSRQTLAVYRAAVAARAHAKGDATWAWGGEQR
jgi:glycosyltransferase involved in cell wall biosynthesis